LVRRGFLFLALLSLVSSHNFAIASSKHDIALLASPVPSYQATMNTGNMPQAQAAPVDDATKAFADQIAKALAHELAKPLAHEIAKASADKLVKAYAHEIAKPLEHEVAKAIDTNALARALHDHDLALRRSELERFENVIHTQLFPFIHQPRDVALDLTTAIQFFKQLIQQEFGIDMSH
jgi:hypothetical protein